jgi:hypothetical protein
MSAAPAAKRDEHMVKLVAHGATAAIGVMLVAGGLATLMSSLTIVLAVGDLVFGGALLACTYASWRGSRIGWSFAVTIDGLVCVSSLLGSTKLAQAAHVVLAVALIPCIMAGVACVLLASFHADYDNT